MKTLIFFLLFFVSLASQAKIVFPNNDSLRPQKVEATKLINLYMGRVSAVKNIQDSHGILLWANQARVIPSGNNDEGNYQETRLPSFTPSSDQNEEHLRKEIENQCQCSTSGQDIIGILIASPVMAAKMYYRAGWLGYQGTELDGLAPPIVIIYHEFAHANDYLLHPDYFFDMATLPSSQWMNEAEKSAVMQQNDFVGAIYSNAGLSFARRSSYGKNELFLVNGLFDIK